MPCLAVVTGTSRGLGRAVVSEFARAGWHVIAVTRRNESALPPREGVTPLSADVVQDGAVAALRAVVGDRPLDLLVNNAAVGAEIVPLASSEVDVLLTALNVNVAAPFRLIKGLLPNLLEAPNPLIVNVSSRLASLSAQARGDYVHLASSYAYRVSKAAQNMLTIAVAKEFEGRIRCWAIHPGALSTDMALADADKRPDQAARELRDLVEQRSPASPRFHALGGGDLDW